ncbi:putative N(6)-L-threonylcarbamoyladenine synthase NDAI_0B03270 [Naumovozyma dairenensis CBS 421]|uniref:N(6)-L-threonylcarbamoyladenine synthase n=1 Tax=Naumovozyma dairenensis (strain ATCC 10597 / BCRC 20456 / CBS 421 / NBRC 0211 / NRRL Y-12639) TaxID=1071378 RepID=G0W6F0_NAUDC|nr:hypothetical protein NDAI_0B03270 [Naumovozyma dairenensis CBS 421]CCD23361.1 hypothetical protein NDAI_0B03270 [Naumovozyma dairenensis CBS 421]
MFTYHPQSSRFLLRLCLKSMKYRVTIHIRSLTAQYPQLRHYNVLAIETSCDDTCLAIINRSSSTSLPENNSTIRCNLKSTLNSKSDGGIIPTKAQEHHQSSISDLISESLTYLPANEKIDLICTTRGPGMMGSLSTGLTMGKGLSLAWNIRWLVFIIFWVHLLIPRMFADEDDELDFPFISLIVSGGHTCLIYSESVLKHEILVDTLDIALGDSLDKCGREIGINGNMIGKEMEKLTKSYTIDKKKNDQRMILPNPLKRTNEFAFSFAPFLTAVKTHLSSNNIDPKDVAIDVQKEMAYEIQEAIFDHLLLRIKKYMIINHKRFKHVKNFICSGGVSANSRLRIKLNNGLNEFFKNFHYPPLEYCTDNALMIGWAGIELYENKTYPNLRSNRNVLPIRKWPLNDLLNVPGWQWDGIK